MEAGRGRVLRSIAVGALLGAVVACVVLLGGDDSLPRETGLLEAAVRHGAAAVGKAGMHIVKAGSKLAGVEMPNPDKSDWHWACKHHIFKNLCTPKQEEEDESGHPLKPWYMHRGWLNTASRIKTAHEADTERQKLFKKHVEELRAQSLEDKEGRLARREDKARNSSAFEQSILNRWDKEREESKATNDALTERRDAARARINARYQARIQNVSGGWGQVQKWTEEARKKEEARDKYLKDLTSNKLKPGYHWNTRCEDQEPCKEREYRPVCTSQFVGGCLQCPECPEESFSFGCMGASNGTCIICPDNACNPGEHLDGCGGFNQGTCKKCVGSGEPCAEGEYIKGCSGKSPGECTTCPVCDGDRYRIGCRDTLDGECAQCTQCLENEYEISPCTATENRVCGKCSSLPACGDNEWRQCGSGTKGECTACEKCPDEEFLSGCGANSKGTCEKCHGCPTGFVNEGCGTVSGIQDPGTCEACGECEGGEYRDGCVYLSEGVCTTCQDCGGEKFLVRCGKLDAGQCRDCVKCQENEFETHPCGGTSARTCESCELSPACGEAKYRAGCGTGEPGACTQCPACERDRYRVGCSGIEEGNCVECGTCNHGEYREGCTGVEAGTCTACQECRPNHWLKGCSYTSPGVCTKCEHCGFHRWLDGCGSDSPGTCRECTVCAEGEFEVSPCNKTHDRVCASCESQPRCEGGEFRECGNGVDRGCKICRSCMSGSFRQGCQGLEEGTCHECAGCPVGKVRENCTFLDAGACVDCGGCGDGEWREGCVYLSEGHCQECRTCENGNYLYGCGEMNKGTCEACVVCSESEYEVRACEGSQSRECASCESLEVCEPGHFREEYGHGSQGECVACRGCGTNSYRRGCGVLDEGVCAPCPDTCEDGKYLDGCQGQVEGTCETCGSCPVGEYRHGCKWTDPGSCVECEVCPDGEWLEGCGGTHEGTCKTCTACGPGEYEVTPCSATEDRVCASCSGLDDCGPQKHRQCGNGLDSGCLACENCGQADYRVGCGGLNAGTCKACGGCPFGQVREDCGGHYAGECVDCGTCESGEWRDGCIYMSQGNCTTCETCSTNHFLVGCGGMQAGSCHPCVNCNENEYELDACSGTQKRTCTSCSMLPVCDQGKFRSLCGHGSQGACHDCASCPVDEYRVECHGLNPGTCQACPDHCEPHHYLQGCSGLSAGSCLACTTCNEGHWKKGCTYTSPGTCEKCEDCGANMFLTGCGGFEPGSCSKCTECGDGEYEVTPCTATQDRVCAACTSLPTCDSGTHRTCGKGSTTECEPCAKCDKDGDYRVGCGGLNEGTCEVCQGCDPGQVREGCGTVAEPMSMGQCEECGSCEDGEFRAGCVYLSEGTCQVCQGVGESQWLEGCGDINPGVVRECTICSADEFEAAPCTAHSDAVCHACSDLAPCELGHYMSECGHGVKGECVACPSCPEGQYLDGCEDSSPGTCVTCQNCDAGQYRENCPGDTGMEPGTCANCAPCERGYFRTDCGGLAEGECTACGECPHGSYRDGCELMQPGQCIACGECAANEYRTGCDGIDGGACTQCKICEAGKYKAACSGLEEGTCEDCSVCGEKEFTLKQCTEFLDTECSDCSLLESCPFGTFRHGCGHGEEGVCQNCAPCDDGFHRVGCGGDDEGECVACDPDMCEGNSTYLEGCHGMNVGTCKECAACKDGFFSQGCGGRHAGACLACDSFPCEENYERHDCGGDSMGTCMRAWNKVTPPPEDLAWAKYATSEECTDDGTTDGKLTAAAEIPQFVRLGACNKGSVKGEMELPQEGEWIISFFVGIPGFKRGNQKIAEPQFPMENVAKTLPKLETVTAIINGQERTWKNDEFMRSYRKYGDIKVQFILPSPTSKVQYELLFDSSGDVPELHMLVGNGQASYNGLKEMDITPALATLLPGEGQMYGVVRNAIDGVRLSPGRSVSDGYGGRMQLPDQEAMIALMIGTALYKEVVPHTAKYMVKSPAGDYTCEATVPGFYSYFHPNCDIREGSYIMQNIIMSPFLNPGDIRAILVWTKQPKDLDLVIDFPHGDEWGGKYYRNKDDCRITWMNKRCRSNDWLLIGQLDNDQNQGYGPETITLRGTKPGNYIFRVHNYKGRTYESFDKATNTDQALAESQSFLSLYIEDDIHYFQIENYGYTSGEYWNVAVMDGVTRQISECTPSKCPTPKQK